jgi:hypothetical protein
MPLDLHTVLVVAVVVAVLLLGRRLLNRRPARPAPDRAAPDRAAPAPVAASTPPSGAGGWRGLAERWPAAGPAPRPIARRATIAFGAIRWKNCVVVGVEPQGLLLAVHVPLLGGFGTRPVAIPWAAIGAPRPARLYGSAAVVLPLGDPPIEATMPLALWQKILDARARSAPAASETIP